MFSQIQESNLDSIRESVWRLNKSSVNLQMQGLIRVEDIIYLEIRTPDEKVFASAGEHQAENTLTRTYPINYQYRGASNHLGNLVIVATLNNVYQRLWDTFIIILVTQGIKTFLVSVFILFLVHSLVIRHLMALAAYFKNINPRGKFDDFHLNRRDIGIWRNDELDQVVGAFNSMQHQIFRAYSKLRLSEGILKKSQKVALFGSWHWDLSSGHLEMSEELLEILGLDSLDQKLFSLDELIAFAGEDEQALLREHIETSKRLLTPTGMEHRVVLKDGTVKYVRHQIQNWSNADDETAEFSLIGTIQDITEQHLDKLELEKLANYDSLTGLPNRLLFHKHLEKAISHAGHLVMLAIIDLDGFKEVNDSLGHQSGDKLLQLLKPRFLSLLREGDMVARLGGDEFGVILSPVGTVEEGIRAIEQIRLAIQQPFNLEEMEVQVDASIGVSVYPLHSGESGNLLRFADIAMYQAKLSKSGYALYETELDPHSPRRLSLISDLRKALDAQQICLYYQPKVDLKTGRIMGLEALSRWIHPIYGFVMPNDFIHLIERSQIVRPFTLWVVERAVRDHLELERGGNFLPVSVNISARNLRDPSFSNAVGLVLDRHGMNPEALVLEITESAIMDDPKKAMETIQTLDQMGVALSIDDFGTGYSSLAYLKRLPVDELKIDKSFVRDMVNDPSDRIIVKSTIDLAHNLGLVVTAEGVESPEALAMLSEFQCENAQGYHFARPMPLDALNEWLSIHDLVSAKK